MYVGSVLSTYTYIMEVSGWVGITVSPLTYTYTYSTWVSTRDFLHSATVLDSAHISTLFRIHWFFVGAVGLRHILSSLLTVHAQVDCLLRHKSMHVFNVLNPETHRVCSVQSVSRGFNVTYHAQYLYLVLCVHSSVFIVHSKTVTM